METTRNAEVAKKILDAALSLWNEKGYADTTMRELARRVGMGASSLYFYFRSKEEIVLFLYRQVNENARAKFHAEDKGENDLGANYRRFLTIKLALLEPQRSCLSAVLKEAIDPESKLNPLNDGSATVLEGSLELFQDLVARSGIVATGKKAKRDGSEKMLARVLWTVHLGVLLYWLHDRSKESRNTHLLAERVASFVAMVPTFAETPALGDTLKLLSAVFDPPPEPEVPREAATSTHDDIPARDMDVVVIGAGPIGAMYASFLKQQRPKTSILVLDRAQEPGHKIGESTLSGFCKAMRSVGIRHEVMQRLFYPKNGLGFFHVDESIKDLTKAPEYILETFNETFQVERRVLDSLIITNARRLGIQIVQGAEVAMETSRIGKGEGNIVDYRVGNRDFRARASLVVDASGPATTIARKLGLRTDKDVAFQTSSVWTYYSDIAPLGSYRGWKGQSQFVRDQYTQHLCFREGWLWYIPVVSWQAAPTANLNQLLDRMMRTGRALPSREDLERDFACPSENIVSIGLSLRSDRDPRIKDDPRAALEHYSKKYPTIGKLLHGAKNLEDHYGPHTTTLSRLNYRGHSTQVAGDGWLLVGDAAFFVDPLISPGLTGGVAGAFMAAAASAAALDRGDCGRRAFAKYEAYVAKLQGALERDNELVYMSFNHPEALALIQRVQEIDARLHFQETESHDYDESDTNVWGILNPKYQEFQLAAWSLFREEESRVLREVPIEEQTPHDYDRLVTELDLLMGPYADKHRSLTPYVGQNAERMAR